MKFTITTSFYNGSKFIDNLYDKIKLQTYKNWEWIVTDDFSSDDGKQKLIELSKKDRRIKYVEQSKKKEMFWNPQFFCKNSDIIIQIDQDDYPLPKALEVYHHFFTKFPEVILITCSGNMYNENGDWRAFYNPDYRKHNNMSCGHLTFLRAWRNNPNINFDFNPNDWMKYFYNDLSIACGLEEYGKVLNLPRNLYYYTHRDDSISHLNHDNIQDVRNENTKLIDSIINRRHDNTIDTICRYFEPIFNITHSFMNNSLNCSSEQIKISYYLNNISSQEKNLLKNLFFDFDLNFNIIEGDEDFLIYGVNVIEDIEKFLTLPKRNEIKNKQLIIHNFYKIPTEKSDEMLNLINTQYPFYFQIDEHMILTLLG